MQIRLIECESCPKFILTIIQKEPQQISFQSIVTPSRFNHILQSYISAVQAFFAVLIQRQPVQHFFNITIPEIPLMGSRTFLISYICTKFTHKISELTVRRKKRIIQATCKIHVRKWNTFFFHISGDPFRIDLTVRNL